MAWNNLSDPIFEHAAQRAGAPALVEGPEALDYRGLAALVGKASVYLRDRGIGEGDRIGVALTNSIDHVVLMAALWRVGAALVGLGMTTAITSSTQIFLDYDAKANGSYTAQVISGGLRVDF